MTGRHTYEQIFFRYFAQESKTLVVEKYTLDKHLYLVRLLTHQTKRFISIYFHHNLELEELTNLMIG